MAALTEAKVPDIGDFTDIPVIELLVAVGDAVEVESPLVELESDKATFEVPSPVAGVIKEIKIAVGDKVSEGTVLVVIDEAGAGGAPEGDAAPAAEPAATAAAPAEASPAPAATAAPAPAQSPVDAGDKPVTGSTDETSGADDSAPIFASPTVRRMAREEGIDLRALAGSGRLGRITKDDLSRPAAPAGAGDGGLGLAPWPVVNFEKLGPVTREPLSKIGKLSAANLARNWVRIPHVTHNDDADITELEAFRKQLNTEQQDVKVTMVALLLKHRLHP